MGSGSVLADDPVAPRALQRLLDEAAIRRVHLDYCRGVDRRDWELVRSCYHRDAVDHHGPYSGGIDGFIAWAIEFVEPPGGSRTWKLLERIQPGLFSQLVVVPLFRDHRILSQVAGHGMNVVKALPPLVVTEEDLDSFASALEETVSRAERMPRALVRFALGAARAGGRPRRRLARA